MIYLDNAATTRIHPQVLATYSQVAQEFLLTRQVLTAWVARADNS